MGSNVCKILCTPFVCTFFFCKNSIFPSPVWLPKLSTNGLQSQMLWGPIFTVKDLPGWGAQYVVQNSQGSESWLILFFCLGGSPFVHFLNFKTFKKIFRVDLQCYVEKSDLVYVCVYIYTYIYTQSWITLLYSWNQHNIINQLYFKNSISLQKRKEKGN